MSIAQEGNELHQPNKVERVEVVFGENVVRANYYVEGGIIVAMIGDKVFRCPVSSISASDTVRAIIMETAMARRLV